MAENAEDALRVNHLADDADRLAGLDVPLVAVNSRKDPEAGVSDETALQVHVDSQGPHANSAARLNDHVADQQALSCDAQVAVEAQLTC